jgi:hypothetical protein
MTIKQIDKQSTTYVNGDTAIWQHYMVQTPDGTEYEMRATIMHYNQIKLEPVENPLPSSAVLDDMGEYP